MNGTEECARYCFLWMVFLGSSVCVGEGSHASVELLHDALKGKAKDWHQLFVYIVMAIFAKTAESYTPYSDGTYLFDNTCFWYRNDT